MKKLAMSLALAAVVTVAPASTAHAGSYVRRDATADVVVSKFSEPVDGEDLDEDAVPALVPAPQRREGDIVSSGVRHRGRQVVLTMRYRALTRTNEVVGHLFSIRTNEKVRRDITIIAGPGMRRGEAIVLSRRGETRCRGLRKQISYAKDRIRVVVPRRCLSGPRWVQVGMGTMSLRGGAVDEETLEIFADDSRTDGVLRDTLGWGPRVRHN